MCIANEDTRFLIANIQFRGILSWKGVCVMGEDCDGDISFASKTMKTLFKSK